MNHQRDPKSPFGCKSTGVGRWAKYNESTGKTKDRTSPPGKAPEKPQIVDCLENPLNQKNNYAGKAALCQVFDSSIPRGWSSAGDKMHHLQRPGPLDPVLPGFMILGAISEDILQSRYLLFILGDCGAVVFSAAS